MKQTKHILMSLFIAFTLFSCESHDVLQPTTVTLSLVMPQGITNATVSNITLSAKNVNTSKKTAITLSAINDTTYSFTLMEGLYDLTLTGEISYELNKETYSDKIKAYKEALTFTGDNNNEATLTCFIVKDNANFVIAEIFFTGTLTPEGKQYNGDKYFRIFNNADSLLYADGLVLLESDFLTVSKYNYTPDIMSQAMAVQALYRIPGNGTQYPVEPGKSVLICDNAIDHRVANSNSFDLTSANFEWYDESTNPNYADIDNEAVPNLEKIYCYTLTIWGPHNRGFSSYAIGRIPQNITNTEYLTAYSYAYNYDLVTQAGTFAMSGTSYRFENSWIIDAVNLSVSSKFQWIVTDPSLDQGWTYCGTIDSDKTRYGKSIRRKVLSNRQTGTPILQDTNNSTNDFNPEQPANPFYFE